MADEVIKLAFDYAQAEADMLAKFGPAPASESVKTAGPTDGLDRRVAQVRAQISQLQAQVKDLSARLRTAPRRQKDALARQLVAAQAQFELLQSRADFLTTLGEFERGNGPGSPGSNLQAQIDELQRSMQTVAKPKVAATANQQAPAEPTGLVELGEHCRICEPKSELSISDLTATEAFGKTVAVTRAPAGERSASNRQYCPAIEPGVVGRDPHHYRLTQKGV